MDLPSGSGETAATAAPASSSPPAAAARADTAAFVFSIDGIEDIELRITALDGVEAMSELFWFQIQLACDDELPDLESLPGRGCMLKIAGTPDSAGPMERLVRGLVARIERLGDGMHQIHYAVDLAPLHWLLTQRRQSRIFQTHNCADMSVPGIVAKVMADAGLPATALRLALHEKYEPREYVVQYRESDWDFVARLLEAEGIFFFFEHAADGLTMVLGDGRASLTDNPGASQFKFRNVQGLVPDAEHVFAITQRHEIRSGRVTLDDFDFQRPPLDLRSAASAPRDTGLEISDYPGEFADRQAGQRYATIRLEEQQWQRRVLRMSATVRILLAGRLFKLTEHPQESLNTEYLLLRVEHRVTQSPGGREEQEGGRHLAYTATATILSSSVSYRPPRVTPRPFVHGSQTALVCGPQAEEIYTDEYGRVKVQFHWDEQGKYDEFSSCWVRVSQGMAGGQYGILFLPRVGQEVIVDFLEGNPDQPIITGRVYNRDHMPPYTLPDHKSISAIRTCSTPGAKGGNEIRFDDAKGNEQLLLFAQNSLHLRSQGSRYESVGGDAHQTIAGDAFESYKKNKLERVKLDLQTQVDGSKWDWVQGNEFSVTKGKYDHYVKGLFRLHNADGIVLASDTSVTLWSHGNFIKIDKNGITIVGSVVNINSGGSADPGAMGDGPLPKEPVPAATTEFGHNVRYTADGSQGSAAGTDTTKQAPTSWIEIELIDELGQPIPGETYEIKLPDGKSIRGTLDQLGRAHVAVPDPGLCEVTFPKLDAAAWEKVG